MARPKSFAEYGNTALSISPSRTCKCQSSGLRMVMRVLIYPPLIREKRRPQWFRLAWIGETPPRAAPLHPGFSQRGPLAAGVTKARPLKRLLSGVRLLPATVLQWRVVVAADAAFARPDSRRSRRDPENLR
jgi:hypothetical protein